MSDVKRYLTRILATKEESIYYKYYISRHENLKWFHCSDNSSIFFSFTNYANSNRPNLLWKQISLKPYYQYSLFPRTILIQQVFKVCLFRNIIFRFDLAITPSITFRYFKHCLSVLILRQAFWRAISDIRDNFSSILTKSTTATFRLLRSLTEDLLNRAIVIPLFDLFLHRFNFLNLV